jgi:hypothetical protein
MLLKYSRGEAQNVKKEEGDERYSSKAKSRMPKGKDRERERERERERHGEGELGKGAKGRRGEG